MDETGFIQKQNSHKVVVSKGSSNVWSKCADANFHITCVVCFYAAKYVAVSLLIFPVKWFNRGFPEGFILRVLALQQHQKVLSILLYS